MNEIWQNIKDYEGLYQVSNLGRVKSIRCKNERILKPINNDGYLRVALHKEGKVKYFYIHRLVAEAFILNPNNQPQVNHKDEDRSNNQVKNLEWCTAEYNDKYGTRNKRIIEKLTNGKKSKTVCQYTIDGKFIMEWASSMEIERQLGFCHSNINKCCGGKIHFNTAYGYIWRYKE